MRMEYNSKNIIIVKDSQASIAAMKSIKTTEQIVLNCCSLFIKLADHNVVKLISVLGHAGKEGNERADELAKKRCIFPSCKASAR